MGPQNKQKIKIDQAKISQKSKRIIDEIEKNVTIHNFNTPSTMPPDIPEDPSERDPLQSAIDELRDAIAQLERRREDLSSLHRDKILPELMRATAGKIRGTLAEAGIVEMPTMALAETDPEKALTRALTTDLQHLIISNNTTRGRLQTFCREKGIAQIGQLITLDHSGKKLRLKFVLIGKKVYWRPTSDELILSTVQGPIRGRVRHFGPDSVADIHQAVGKFLPMDRELEPNEVRIIGQYNAETK